MTSVDEYIAGQPKAVQTVLRRVRRAIRAALPNADETLAYKMPTYRIAGKAVLHFAAWKHHYSIYPANSRVVAAFKAELAGFAIEKSTLQLSYEEPVPVNLIARIAAFRAGDATPGKRRER